MTIYSQIGSSQLRKTNPTVWNHQAVDLSPTIQWKPVAIHGDLTDINQKPHEPSKDFSTVAPGKPEERKVRKMLFIIDTVCVFGLISLGRCAYSIILCRTISSIFLLVAGHSIKSMLGIVQISQFLL